MSLSDVYLGALCAWRENRGGGRTGMQSVLNVLANRATKRNTSLGEEVVRPWQFSSMTAPGDAQLIVYPKAGDPEFAVAIELAQSAVVQGSLPDITDGATSYYATTMTPPPNWAAAMTQTVTIAGQVFFK